MAHITLSTIQIVLMAHYKNLLIQIILMAHFSENDMIQLKDMFQIVATWLQFSTEEYLEWVQVSLRTECKKMVKLWQNGGRNKNMPYLFHPRLKFPQDLDIFSQAITTLI